MQSAQFKLHADIEERHWWFLGRRRILRDLARRLLLPSTSATVVDVGCGTGGNIAALARDYTCVGIDTSPEAVRFAARRFPQVRFICGQAPGDLGKIAAQAGLFLLTDVLEHIPDDAAFLTGLVGSLRPGAHLMLTVPADMSLWSEHDVNYGHHRRYDRRGLERLFSGLPATVRLISHFNARLYPAVRAVRALNRLMGRSWGEAGTDLKMPSAPVNGLLARIFAGEGKALVDLLEGRRRRGYAFGVSLIAVLRREVRAPTPTHTAGI